MSLILQILEMSLLLKALFAYCVTLNIWNGIDGLTTCIGTSFKDSLGDSQCRSILFEPVCFICNISRNTKLISWHTGSIELAKGNFNLESSHAGGLKLNGCDSSKYSLLLERPNTEYNKALYVCKKGLRIISKFCLELHVSPTLTIDTNGTGNGALYLPERSKSPESLECVVTNAVPPLSVIWKLNDTEAKRIKFTNSSEEPFTLSYTLPLQLSQNTNVTITCAIEGIFVPSLNTSLQIITYDNNGTVSNPSSIEPVQFLPGNIWLLVVCFIISTCCVIFIISCSRRRRLRQSSSKRFHETAPDVSSIDNGETGGSLHDPHLFMENCAYDVTMEADESNNHLETSLVTKIKVSGTHEYWKGDFSIGNGCREKCFVKTLSDQATLHEASRFKAIAKQLDSMKKSEHIVRILSVNIEDDRYAITYEFLECGSLRNFVRTQYDQRRFELEADLKIHVQQLLTFAANIASAMEFIVSQNFTHPVLSLKKVLLTTQCTCKLYDIYPKDMVMTKVNAVLNKEHAPIAWMSPETIFLSTYSTCSDVWGFSVLLWELFTLGETPYTGRSNDEIERSIRAGVNLPQPLICPGAVYEVMLMSWTNKEQARPSFVAINQKLHSMLDEYGSPDENEYLTLDPSIKNEYI